MTDHGSTITWKIETNVTKEPIELIIDSGSEICVVAADKLKNNIELKKPIYLTGINGADSAIQTQGSVIGTFKTKDNSSWVSQIHIIDGKYAGQFDGYLGYDMLKRYGAIIDFAKGIIWLRRLKNEAQIDAESKHMEIKRNKIGQIKPKKEEIENVNNEKSTYEKNNELKKIKEIEATTESIRNLFKLETEKEYLQSITIEENDNEVTKLFKI